MKFKTDWSVKVTVVECGGEYSLKVTKGDGTFKLYPRVTTDEDSIRLLAHRINTLDVSEVHIDDILEDFLG